MYNDDFLHKKLDERKQQHAFRKLRLYENKIDFCSNDYLGIVKNNLLSGASFEEYFSTGSGGSRLLAGNYALIETVEKEIASFHQSQAALIFNSGFDANIGVLACIPQRGDTIIYDSLSHASIRDGIRLSFAQSHSFGHNDLDSLEHKLKNVEGNVFVVTESVFSMDGDYCPLQQMVLLCKKYNAHLIVDEAHATGVTGDRGEGLAQHLQLNNEIFCRIHTFGKACGCHGAVVLGTEQLRDYLVNFARSFVYSTSLPPHDVAVIQSSYKIFPEMVQEREHLKKLVKIFQQAEIRFEKLHAQTPIQGVIVPGNNEVKSLATRLQEHGLDVRPIIYPTVRKGRERLRIVLHAFNTIEELDLLINCVKI